MPDLLAGALAPLVVLDERGAGMALGGFWARQLAVLAFVRHFG